MVILFLMVLPFDAKLMVSGAPSQLGLENQILRVFDKRHQVLWQVHLDDIDPQAVLSDCSRLILDVDGDRAEEILWGYPSAVGPTDQFKLLCFSSGGKLRWEFVHSFAHQESVSQAASGKHPPKLLLAIGQKENFILYAPQRRIHLRNK